MLLAREGMHLSTSMVGRILNRLQARGALQLPLQYISTRKRRLAREYGVRNPRDYEVKAPGDLVQLDTLDVRPVAGKIFKHFTARDVVSRWDVLSLRQSATARTASDHLEAILERMPFPVTAIQVDGGSEFMAGFEQSCRTKGVRLFVLPPRSPKLNSCGERAQRTHSEEFYECTSADATVPALSEELRRREPPSSPSPGSTNPAGVAQPASFTGGGVTKVLDEQIVGQTDPLSTSTSPCMI